MRKHFLFILPLVFLIHGSCSENRDIEFYHKFKNKTWPRFEYLHFEIPVSAPDANYDVHLFIHHTKEYEFDDMDFNMMMNTPSGEERIKEYRMEIRKKDGGFIGQFTGDSCEISIPLKRGLWLTEGTLTIDLENLVPRLQTKGLLGLGIRLHPVR